MIGEKDNKQRYLVAYDISHPKRLRRVARIMEKHALRTQKSVFQFYGTKNALLAVINELREVIDHEEDLVQAWRVGQENRVVKAMLGKQPENTPRVAVLSATQRCFVAQHQKGMTQ